MVAAMTTLRDELIRQVPRVFRALPPISDTDLFPPGFEFAGAGPWELAELRGRDRFEVAGQVEWLDADVVYRMSGYARWYFAPTFLLLMLHHIEQYQFEGLMCVFAYSPTVLEQMGLDPCASEIPPSFVPRVDMPQYVHDLSIEDCLPLTESRPTALDIHHFAVAASHFNGVERKLADQFIGWADPWFPEETGLKLARLTFWDRP